MIDRDFWETVAKEWTKTEDGIKIPEPQTGNAGEIRPEAFGSMEELDDLLAELGL